MYCYFYFYCFSDRKTCQEDTVTQIKNYSAYFYANTGLSSLRECQYASWTIEYFFYWLMFFLLLLTPFFVWPSSDIVLKKRFLGISGPIQMYLYFLSPFSSLRSDNIISSVPFIFVLPAILLNSSASFIISLFIYSMTVAGKWVSRFFVTEDTFTIFY